MFAQILMDSRPKKVQNTVGLMISFIVIFKDMLILRFMK